MLFCTSPHAKSVLAAEALGAQFLRLVQTGQYRPAFLPHPLAVATLKISRPSVVAFHSSLDFTLAVVVAFIKRWDMDASERSVALGI